MLVSRFQRFGLPLAAMGLVAAGVAMRPAPAEAWWAHGWGWGGVRVGVVLPPVVVAPPLVYAAPPVAYAPPPPPYYARQPFWVPGHWQGGYWVPAHWA